jgi:hypothetical protein
MSQLQHFQLLKHVLIVSALPSAKNNVDKHGVNAIRTNFKRFFKVFVQKGLIRLFYSIVEHKLQYIYTYVHRINMTCFAFYSIDPRFCSDCHTKVILKHFLCNTRGL